MAYIGQSIPIPLGQLGLKTDDPMTSLPPNAAILANNVRMVNSRVEKSRGSDKFNSTALTGAVVSLFDYWPTPTLQRLIALTSDGKAWRDTGDGTFTAYAPIATGLGSLTPDAHMVAGGAEEAGRNKKLFIFTGSSQVKRIDGDGSSLASISDPSPDWASSFPTFGIQFNGRLAAFGNANNRHTIYFSDLADHEDFNGTPTETPLFSVFPGEGDGLVSAQVYKGRLFLFKKPYGVYYIDDFGSSDPSNWTVKKLSDAFGIASPHSSIQVLDDLWAMNAQNSITSLQATDAYGDMEAGDILSLGDIEFYFKEQFDAVGLPYVHAIYYNERKYALFTGRNVAGSPQNRILIVDIAKQQPRFSIETKDQPTCLALRKGSDAIDKPIYGSDSGFVFKMESANYNVGGIAYAGEFQTPYIDFSFADATLAGKNKIFDFLEMQFVAVGNYDFMVDVYCDNQFIETLRYTQSQGAALDSFVLDTDELGSVSAQDRRKPLHATGRRISFKFYNNNANQYFKLEKFIVSFRLSGEQQKPVSGVFSL